MYETYETIITQPLLNVLNLIYDWSGDVGVAIILTSAALNLLLWPLFAKNYISGQKNKIFSPQIRELQQKYKKDPQKFLEENRKFKKKHGISNGSIFLTLIIQILFLTGLYSLIRKISDGKELDGLYGWVSDSSVVKFGTEAFGFLDVSDGTRSQIWLAFLIAFLAWVQSSYTIKWAPKPDLSKIRKPKVKKKKPGELDPEAIQKQMEKFTIYFLPGLLFFINLGLHVGVSIYFLGSTTIGIIRQIILSNYYSKHVDKLVEDMAQSDPLDRDERDATADEVEEAETTVVTSKPKKKVANKPLAKKTTKKKKSAKGNKKKNKK